MASSAMHRSLRVPGYRGTLTATGPHNPALTKKRNSRRIRGAGGSQRSDTPPCGRAWPDADCHAEPAARQASVRYSKGGGIRSSYMAGSGANTPDLPLRRVTTPVPVW